MPSEESGNQSQVSSNREISFQKSNDIYERHLTLKGRGFPLWIPGPNRALPLGYRRTGVRIGDVGIITNSGAFSFLFNICLPHNDPVNSRMLPEHFAPISPPIEATDIENFIVFKNDSHLPSSSVKRSQTGTATSDIVFESSASEGAVLIMPRGARSEDLKNLAPFREYAAANVANWYRFVNGPRGLETKNGDIRLVVGCDKTTSWGIATFANQTQQNSCRLRFGLSEGDSASTYTWSENSGVADVRAGPDSDESEELRIDTDSPDVQFENQCLFVRTLNVTLADDVWADIHYSSGSIPVDPRNSQYPRVKNYSNSNRPHSNNPDNGSNISPSQGAQSRTQRRLQGVDITSDENPPIYVSGPVESIAAHPSKVLNDTLLATMVITHDDDWSSVTQYDTLPDPHGFVPNILASRDTYQENGGVVFLQPKKIINEISEGSTSANRVQEAAVVQGSPAHHASPLMLDKPRNTFLKLSANSTSDIHTDRESCASSQTSTDLYEGHEPYESFVHKAHTLLTSLFPNDLPVEMERMAGGSYNRVVGGILRHNSTDPMSVILRIPRGDYLRPADEVAVMRYLTEMTDIPVPKVLYFDPNSDNAISRPYMVLSRLRGRCLDYVYSEMPFERKKRVVCDIARVLGKFSNVSFETIGTLRAGYEDEDAIVVGQAWVPSDLAPGLRPSPALSRSIASYLEERFSYLEEDERRRLPGQNFVARYTTAFRAAASKLPIPNADVQAKIVLFHTDFASRNIFVDEDTGEVTGILDWDRAASAPVEAAWTMPAWLWDRNACGSNELGWESPDNIPDDPLAAELRELFLREIGKVIPDFVDVVRRSKLIHELLIFARLWLHSTEIFERVDEFLKGMGVEVEFRPSA